MRNTVIKILSVATFLVAVLVVFSNRAWAAEFKFGSAGVAMVGGTYEVALTLDSPDEAVNAVSGEATYPVDLLEVKEIKDGGSIISFWIDPPKTSGGEIVFSGIIPGGYHGNAGRLFSVVFVPKNTGSGEISLAQASVLLNDGQGTAAAVSSVAWPITVESPNLSSSATPPPVDTVLPEPFTPVVSASSDIFSGAYFLAFNAQDKDRGIDHYEVEETHGSKIDPDAWIRATSPYLLTDQKLQSHVRVKAIDKAGNARIAELPPAHPLPWYEMLPRWGIMILIVVVIFVVILVSWRATVRRKN